jgi:hypothetical protein
MQSGRSHSPSDTQCTEASSHPRRPTRTCSKPTRRSKLCSAYGTSALPDALTSAACDCTCCAAVLSSTTHVHYKPPSHLLGSIHPKMLPAQAQRCVVPASCRHSAPGRCSSADCSASLPCNPSVQLQPASATVWPAAALQTSEGAHAAAYSCQLPAHRFTGFQMPAAGMGGSHLLALRTLSPTFQPGTCSK